MTLSHDAMVNCKCFLGSDVCVRVPGGASLGVRVMFLWIAHEAYILCIYRKALSIYNVAEYPTFMNKLKSTTNP